LIIKLRTIKGKGARELYRSCAQNSEVVRSRGERDDRIIKGRRGVDGLWRNPQLWLQARLVVDKIDKQAIFSPFPLIKTQELENFSEFYIIFRFRQATSKRVMSPSRLFFFDVKDGWGLLCKILHCEIPEEPFPHANDKVAVQRFIEGLAKDAMVRWLQIFAVSGVVVASVVGVRLSGGGFR
jgi:hypothetical protein